MKSLINKHENGTIELTVTIPTALVKKTRQEILEEHVKVEELPGFRKGMAPLDMVEKSLGEEHIREDILKKLLPLAYIEAVKEHGLNPVINPKINVQKIDEGSDWVFVALTAEGPKITLGNYKEAVKKVTAKGKIVVPGKEQTPISFNEVSEELLKTATLQIPGIIIDQEVERLLAQTLDEVKRLGLTLDQYLASTGRNVDGLKLEYAGKAEKDIKLEFILQEIANQESIKVEEKEIDEAITQSKTEAERQNLQKNRHLLSNILKQQKTLDFLRNL
jgi:FKBP-type peptidyl-prolyl cis-trans isomerase (trigger factor)